MRVHHLILKRLNSVTHFFVLPSTKVERAPGIARVMFTKIFPAIEISFIGNDS